MIKLIITNAFYMNIMFEIIIVINYIKQKKT